MADEIIRILSIDGGGIRGIIPARLLISRNGNILSRFSALGVQVAAELEVDNAILDGEVIAADETGRPQFYDLVRGTRRPAYAAFDILWLETVPTSAPCHSASAGGGYRTSCLKDHRQSPRRCPFKPEAASSSS